MRMGSGTRSTSQPTRSPQTDLTPIRHPLTPIQQEQEQQHTESSEEQTVVQAPAVSTLSREEKGRQSWSNTKSRVSVAGSISRAAVRNTFASYPHVADSPCTVGGRQDQPG